MPQLEQPRHCINLAVIKKVDKAAELLHYYTINHRHASNMKPTQLTHFNKYFGL